MTDKIIPRKRELWEFFNENAGACDAGEMSPLETLSEADRQVPEFFINALEGYRRVLDTGCGGGYPGLYVAPHVGELVGIDAAPNMIEVALKNAKSLGVTNARVEVGGADGLPYAEDEFDGAMLCGLLESMDWESVHRMMPEVRRVLSPGGRIAALDQDWHDFLSRAPMRQVSIRNEKGRLFLQVVERTLNPHTETDARYYAAPDSPTGGRLLSMMAGKTRISTDGLTPGDLDPKDVMEATYDVAAQFGEATFADLFASHGFADVSCKSVLVPAWGQKILFLTAVSGT